MRRIAVFLIWLALGCGAAGAEEQAKGFLGAQLADVTQEEAAKLGWEAPRGAKVVKPVEGSPAAAAGLQPGDIAVTLDGMEIENMAGFTAAIGGKGPGTAVKLRLLRGGKEKTVSVTLAARPAGAEDGGGRRRCPCSTPAGIWRRSRASRLRRTAGSSSRPPTTRPSACGIWRAARPCARSGARARRAMRARSTPWRCRRTANGWRRGGGFVAPREESDAIRLYEFASGKLVALLKGHADVVYGLAFSPDGSRLISGSGDNTAILWDTGSLSGAGTGIRADARGAEPKLLHRLEGHTDFIFAVGFSPDGSSAVTGSFDHDLRLWRVADGKEIARMTGHGDKVRSLAVAPDGTIASGDRLRRNPAVGSARRALFAHTGQAGDDASAP